MPSPTVSARRFLVFRFAKAFMELHGRSPTVREAAEALPGAPALQTIRDDFHALRHAAGLPFPLRSRADFREINANRHLAIAATDHWMAHSGERNRPGSW